MSETEFLSYLSVTPHLRVLRACGIYPVEANSSKLKKELHRIYMRLSFTFIMLYTVQQIINVYQVRAYIDKVMDSMFLLLTFVDSICKQIVFLTESHKIQELLEIMKGPYFNQGVAEHRPYLTKTVYQAGLLLRVFNNICIVTCFLWVLFPIISHFKEETVEFTIWLPFDANKDPQHVCRETDKSMEVISTTSMAKSSTIMEVVNTDVGFYIVICYVLLQTSWLGYNNSTMDIFIVYLFAQAKTQLSILRNDLENLVIKCKSESTTTSSAFTEVLERRFRNIMHHYGEIIRFSEINESIFHVPILCQFLISGWIICTTAYRTINMSPASGEFLSMILYMICILSELFLFCFYGNEVSHESDKLMESAYNSDWVAMPVKHRRYLLLFMERIKSPIKPKAGNIVPLSINTFVQIIKTSYTFFTFLNNAGNGN